MSGGRLFHSRALATAKVRSPTVAHCVSLCLSTSDPRCHIFILFTRWHNWSEWFLCIITSVTDTTAVYRFWKFYRRQEKPPQMFKLLTIFIILYHYTTFSFWNGSRQIARLYGYNCRKWLYDSCILSADELSYTRLHDTTVVTVCDCCILNFSVLIIHVTCILFNN